MNTAKRIVVNTIAQHVRSVLNICLSLYSTRLILQALGQSDFGIYSLVAGVVAMLGFLTNAMVITTQRQLSYYHGSGDMESVRRMFSNSLLLHIVLGLAIALVMIAIEPFLFARMLVIEEGRVDTAIFVYYLVVLSLLITFLTAPYRALFIARENIVYISIIDIFDGILKLVAAIWLLHYPFNRLIAYSVVMCGIMAFNLIALTAWSKMHFEECLLFPRHRDISKHMLRELTGFAGWTIYSMGCIIGRTQGAAIILNRFFGTVINASYGIAQQLFGAIQFIAQAVVNAMSPQLIKAEGNGDRKRMLTIAELLSKYAFLLLAIVTMPLLFEMRDVLQLWLGDVPQGAVVLCKLTLIAALCDQTTIGLGTANQALGRIRNYSLTINTIKVLTLPAFWLCLYLGYSLLSAMIIYLVFECVCALGRIPFLKYTAGLSAKHFIVHVFGRISIPLIVLTTVCWLVTSQVQMQFRFLLTGCLSVVAGVVAIWFFGLEKDEKCRMCNIVAYKT